MKKIFTAFFFFFIISGIFSEAYAKNGRSIISFGSYPYTKDAKKAPMQWIVLNVLPDGSMLAISKYAIEAKNFNESPKHNITWENSDLREWLNSSFISSAFSKSEQKKLKNIKVSGGDNSQLKIKGGKETDDKVFLLSAEEAEEFFSSKKSRKLYPTPYVKNKKILMSNRGTVNWWLRTVGSRTDNGNMYPANCGRTGCMTRVMTDGTVYFNGTMIQMQGQALYAIRPVILIEPEQNK